MVTSDFLPELSHIDSIRNLEVVARNIQRIHSGTTTALYPDHVSNAHITRTATTHLHGPSTASILMSSVGECERILDILLRRTELSEIRTNGLLSDCCAPGDQIGRVDFRRITVFIVGGLSRC